MAFRWTCRYCNHAQVVSDTNYVEDWSTHLQKDSVLGPICQLTNTIACANDLCRKLTLSFHLYKWPGKRAANSSRPIVGDQIAEWQLLPASEAKPQPDYIPAPLRDDYMEACLIRTLSPKASATLSRRCLQGMIRDFCGISGQTLSKEIDTLRDKVVTGEAPAGVQPDTVDAIDAVRQVGNFGAHMEKDINVIVDIDPTEALALIGLTELLFDEWYVARHKRHEQIASVIAIAGVKQISAKPPQQALPSPDAEKA
jgi:Domain of unknown function (DUF4145)